MITHLLSGGLGNQLFQIYTTISLSIKLGHTFSFQNKKCLGNFSETIRDTYWETLFVSLLSSLDKLNGNMVINYGENNHSYEKINVGDTDFNNLIVLNGYFQSYKYFEEHQDIISSLIGINDYKRHIIDNCEFVSNKNSVSIHFRIGDYKNVPNHHPMLGIEYYRKSLEFVSKTINDKALIVYYFYEEEDVSQVSNMIQLLQMEFKNSRFIQISTSIPDWKQMLIMSLCEHNIIANSTFSLWAGYLNTNQYKIVCYPSIWFGKNLQHNDTNDMFPNSWKKILI